ncbi:MAG TPA: tetratricopeptide repeat protein [Anaerolineae bacterium]|nr:tetratricopeptide repeat protein [Anaerolineae bacterium]
MSNAHVRAQFDEGIERAVGHWLCHWREHGHSPEGEAAAARHALAALRWCIASGRALEMAIDLALAMQAYMMYQGQWSEWEALLHRLLEQASSAASQERRFALRHSLGAVYYRQHRLAESLALSQENYRWALAIGDRRLQADAAINLAEAYLNTDAAEQALVHAEEAASLGAALNLPWKEADGLIDAARALLAQGKLAEAEQRLRRAETLAATTGYPVYQAKAWLFLGQVAARSGCWQEALAHFELALGLVTSYGDEVGRATVQMHIGRTLAELGRLDDASRLLEDAVRIHRRHGNLPAEQIAVQRLQEVMARRSVSEEAWQMESADLPHKGPSWHLADKLPSG